MGTLITKQKRGKGGPAYASPGHRFFKNVEYETFKEKMRGQVVKFVDDPGRHPLLAELLLQDGKVTHVVAAEGLRKGQDIIYNGGEASLSIGSIVNLYSVPDGFPVFNIELTPFDGGKLAKSSGAAAYLISHDEETNTVNLRLASRQVKTLSGNCRATIGVACGGGRLEKPMVKAGTNFYAKKARNQLWPVVRQTAKSAYDHPFGGRSFGKSTTVSRNAPPGRKVGHIAARSTGRSHVKRKLEKELEKKLK